MRKYWERLKRVDWSIVFLAGFCWLLGIAVVIMVGLLIVDGIFEYKAQPAQIGCEAQRMDYRRLYMSDSVICVPYPTRQDTVTVQRR